MASQDRLSTVSGGTGLVLGDEFPTPTYAQWQAHVEKVLRRTKLLAEDAPTPEVVEDVLATETYDGITVHPLYTNRDATASGLPGAAPYVRGARPEGSVAEGWEVRVRHAHPDAAVTNREILADLVNGANSIWLELGGAGLAVDSLGDALAEVHLDMVSVVLDAGADGPQAAEALLRLADEQGVPAAALTGNLGLDPLSVQARTGVNVDTTASVALARHCAEQQPQLRAITVDGLPYHDAGGSDAQELAYSLAAGTTYLRLLTEAGLDVDTAAGLLEFRFAASADQFLTIAKLRAARRLWEQVTRASEASESARAQQQHAVTSSAMMTRRDPWVNMLRTTIAAFAAGVGGAQAVTVQPFDAAIGLPDSFARRLARNTQALLLDESHLAQVIDPAGGSWYVESLTDELAHAAWETFQGVEAAGGLHAALESGSAATDLDATWQRRRRALAHRTDPITGISEFPNLDEPLLEREQAPEPPSGGLARVRYAADYEALRDAADAAASRPTVFLATLGPLASYTARASFTRNLVAAGGIDATEAGATESTDEVLAAYREQESRVVVLCSSDKVYADRAAETADALRAAGAELVLFAGSPDNAPSAVDFSIHTGCDALDALHRIHRTWGVSR
ncbi:methylmalonyl-CoA mutase [Allosaccharopolyspora coralli]|uniref:Methylmalonyl-CoA mutase n=1 Tax=Allosaccharopolyspora coralli TaxID=2665642 RepID=A0A5Q3QBY7_9PSEU|nr:methylmalonyl-CoA mutase family protein [Allosaccharopolyspora coralli]QGK70744.1 methylmalonyl-CoA mutase [Allosaccharopolyspora coralli]